MTAEEIQEKRDEQVMHSQWHSTTIEGELCSLLKIDRLSEEGLDDIVELGIHADNVRKNPYESMKLGLFYLLAKEPSKKAEIIKFFKKYEMISYMKMDDILSFVTSKSFYNGSECTIPEENGEIFIKKIIEEFKNIIKN